MNKTRLSVPKMDCAAEERLVRMALAGHPQIRDVEADLGAREMSVIHDGSAEAVVALIANGSCMWLLARHRHGGAHMKASWIFTTNDVIANIGVIAAAGFVRVFHSNAPDLLVAAVIACVVLNGAVRILRLRK